MVDKNIEKANEIIDKHAEFTDHYADQEYTKEGILKMMEEYAPYIEPVSEEEIDYAAHEAASKIGANTSSNESKYFKKGAKWLQQRQVKQISEKRIEEIAEYLINSVQKAENHNFTGNLDKYYKGCIDGIKAALKELNNG